MRPIVIVGSINADLVTRSKRLPGAGETVHGESFEVFHGGKGANQAVGLAQLGQSVHMLGLVGTDSFSAELKEGLMRNDVRTEAVGTHPGASGVALIQIETSGQNRITVVAGANAALTPEYLMRHEALIGSAGMLLTQLETPMESVELLASLAERYGIALMLDPAPAAPLSGDVLRRISWLTPNFTEGLALLGRTEQSLKTPADAIEMARALHALGPRNILLKLGDFGLAAVTSDADAYYLPAFQVEVLDTTAAGDALNAGLAAALMQGLPVRQALRYASAVAAISVTRAGAQPSMPTAVEVDTFLQDREQQ